MDLLMTPQAPVPATASVLVRRGLRWGLYLPVILLGVIAVGWSAFWFVARGRAEAAIEAGLAREVTAGRTWTCNNRNISGFPFRFDLNCTSLTLEQTTPDGARKLQMGPISATARIYAPSHIIAESPGPMVLTVPDGTRTELTWSNAQISIRLNFSGLERASLIASAPRLAVSNNANAATQAESVELHLRPHPTRPASDRAMDISLTLKAALSPVMDQLVGNADPSNLDAQITVPQAPVFLGGVRAQTLETWRLAGAVADITRVTLKKGKAELSLTGQLGLDDVHRLKGRIEAAQAGIDQIGGIRIGGLLNAGSLLAGRPPANTTSALKPLPAIDLRDGRLFIGPLRLPEPRLEPLY
jgi:hypothetical protein